MFDIIFVAAGIIVAQYTTIFVEGFFRIFHSKLFYIYRIENIPKPFPLKSIKILSSQTENYYFCAQTLKKIMQQMFSFFQDDFAKSEIGHYFCPFFTFPKKSWKKKYTDLYNKWIYLLKEKRDSVLNFLKIL